MGGGLFADIFDINISSVIKLAKVSRMEALKVSCISSFGELSEKFTRVRDGRVQMAQEFGTLATNAQAKIDELISRQHSLVANLNHTLNTSRELRSEISGALITDNAEYRAMVEQYNNAQRAAANMRETLRSINDQIAQLNYIRDISNAKKSIQESANAKDQGTLDQIELIISLLNHTQTSFDVRTRLYKYIIRFGDELESSDGFFGSLVGSSTLRDLNALLKGSLLTAVDSEDNLPFILDGISASDVRQGPGVGDCWLVAILASLANSDPGRIQKIIQVTGLNSYRVRLYDRDGNIIYVDVTPQDLERFKEANSNNAYRTSEEWVSVIEAALAKTPEIYTNTPNRSQPLPYVDGGTQRDEMDIYRALTGNDTDEISSSAESIAQDIYRNWTFDESEFAQRINSGGVAWAGGSGDQPDAPPGYVGNHAFSIIEVYTHDGTTYVKLRNPWGTGEGTQDGYFSVTMEDFRKYWPNIFIGQD